MPATAAAAATTARYDIDGFLKLIGDVPMTTDIQRVRLRFHIRSLSETDTKSYIAHRLKVAGAPDKPLFAPDAFPFIYKYTGGLPRLINTLCDTALVCAYADNQSIVTESVLNGAVEELNWLPYAKRVNQQRLRNQPATDNDYQQALRDHTRALVGVGQRMTQIDALVPALNALTGRMANIENLLRRMAGDMPKLVEIERKGAAKQK